MLLAEAEHSFERVRQRVGGSAGTITDLSKRLEKKESELVETEKELRISKVKAARLKEVRGRVKKNIVKSAVRGHGISAARVGGVGGGIGDGTTDSRSDFSCRLSRLCLYRSTWLH